MAESSIRQQRAINNAPQESNLVDIENMYSNALRYWKLSNSAVRMKITVSVPAKYIAATVDQNTGNSDTIWLCAKDTPSGVIDKRGSDKRDAGFIHT